ncbi:MAG: hypothetical protein H6713_02310 [Myxococcales bacterium]|nr:hypothetical protein [Myxococcales bacterium]
MTTLSTRARAWGRISLAFGLVVGLCGSLSLPGEAGASSLSRLEQPARTVKPASASAAADAVRYTRSGATVRTRGNLDRRFARARAAEERARREAAPAEPPPARASDDQQQQIRERQITMLKKLIRQTPVNDPEYADLVFRLASLYIDKKMYFERRVGELYEPIYQADLAEEAERAKPAARPKPAEPTQSAPGAG